MMVRPVVGTERLDGTRLAGSSRGPAGVGVVEHPLEVRRSQLGTFQRV